MTFVEAVKHISPDNRLRRQGWIGWLTLEEGTGRLVYQEPLRPGSKAITSSDWTPYLQDFQVCDWFVFKVHRVS